MANDNDADDQDGNNQGPGSPGPKHVPAQFTLALPAFGNKASPALLHAILEIELELSSKVALESHRAYIAILEVLRKTAPPPPPPLPRD